MKQDKLIPVLHYSTGSGWSCLINVKSIEAAKRYLMKNRLSDQSISLIKKHGFTLNVWERTDLQVELNGGPKGYVWDIGKTVKTH